MTLEIVPILDDLRQLHEPGYDDFTHHGSWVADSVVILAHASFLFDKDYVRGKGDYHA